MWVVESFVVYLIDQLVNIFLFKILFCVIFFRDNCSENSTQTFLCPDAMTSALRVGTVPGPEPIYIKAFEYI